MLAGFAVNSQALANGRASNVEPKPLGGERQCCHSDSRAATERPNGKGIPRAGRQAFATLARWLSRSHGIVQVLTAGLKRTSNAEYSQALPPWREHQPYMFQLSWLHGRSMPSKSIADPAIHPAACALVSPASQPHSALTWWHVFAASLGSASSLATRHRAATAQNCLR